MLASILILEPAGRDFGDLRRAFRSEAPDPWNVQVVSTADELLRIVAANGDDRIVVIPDRLAEGQSGLALICAIRRNVAEMPIVVVAEQGSVDRAAEAAAAGASDFLVLGEQLQRRIGTLLKKLRGLLEVMDRNRLLHEHNARLREALHCQFAIVGHSTQVKRLMEQIQRVAKIPRPVLVLGERGTGKELVARAIHLAAGPPHRPMVTVNCAAFHDALLESELFGHEKGAFTGADALRRGKFELADGGTLFLDEIANMSSAFQEKILRVVEYGTFTRVGGGDEHHSSARVIAATNRDLREQIARGEFLADLYDRLAFETIEAPPLRVRAGDIPVLARYFLDQFALESPAYGGKRLTSAAVAALERYPFPGNVRELKNIIERAAYRDTGGEITPEDLALPQCEEREDHAPFHETVDLFVRRLIADALREAKGNRAQAARILGLPYHQLRYYEKKYRQRS